MDYMLKSIGVPFGTVVADLRRLAPNVSVPPEIENKTP